MSAQPWSYAELEPASLFHSEAVSSVRALWLKVHGSSDPTYCLVAQQDKQHSYCLALLQLITACARHPVERGSMFLLPPWGRRFSGSAMVGNSSGDPKTKYHPRISWTCSSPSTKAALLAEQTPSHCRLGMILMAPY